MGKQITFGKYQGWDTDNLARAGAWGKDYLEWGARNLKSRMWRQEFERALRQAGAADSHLTALAISQTDAEIDYDEALRIAREHELEAAEYEAGQKRVRAAQRAVEAKYAAILGVSESDARTAINTVNRAVVSGSGFPPRNRFSSNERYQNMQAMYQEWVACYEMGE